MESLDKKLEKLEEKVSKDLKVSFEILKENRNIIKNTLIVPFSTYLICGDYVFPKIYNEARNKDENECVYVTEKIISRSQTISDLGNKLDLPDNLKIEVEEIKLLWNIVQYDLIPLEQFWCLEEEKEDDRIFTNDEKILYDYLMNIANYYLKETEKYYNLAKKENSSKNTEELSNFQKNLNQLKAPYKKTEAYEIFGNKKGNPNVSVFWDAEVGFVDKYKDVNMNLKNNDTVIFEEAELNEIREKVSNFDLLPLERQQELFDEIVLGKKKEEVKSLKLINKDENNKKNK